LTNPVLEWCPGNLVTKADRRGNLLSDQAATRADDRCRHGRDAGAGPCDDRGRRCWHQRRPFLKFPYSSSSCAGKSAAKISVRPPRGDARAAALSAPMIPIPPTLTDQNIKDQDAMVFSMHFLQARPSCSRPQAFDSVFAASHPLQCRYDDPH
jgi:hypothetical protein